MCHLFAHILHLPLSSSFFTIIFQINPIRAGITTLRLHPSQHLPSFTGCALLPLSQYITPFLSYFSSIFPSHMLHLFILHLSYTASVLSLTLNNFLLCMWGLRFIKARSQRPCYGVQRSHLYDFIKTSRAFLPRSENCIRHITILCIITTNPFEIDYDVLPHSIVSMCPMHTFLLYDLCLNKNRKFC